MQLSEEFVVEFAEDLTRNVLITLDVVEVDSHKLVHRVPATDIGPKALKVKMPGKL